VHELQGREETGGVDRQKREFSPKRKDEGDDLTDGFNRAGSSQKNDEHDRGNSSLDMWWHRQFLKVRVRPL